MEEYKCMYFMKIMYWSTKIVQTLLMLFESSHFELNICLNCFCIMFISCGLCYYANITIFGGNGVGGF